MSDRIESDLGYVRDVLDRSQRNASPMSGCAWTIVGIVVAAGMIVAAVTGGSGRGRQS